MFVAHDKCKSFMHERSLFAFLMKMNLNKIGIHLIEGIQCSIFVDLCWLIADVFRKIITHKTVPAHK